MKVLSVVGSRPNLIKLAPMCEALKKHKHIIVNTGQHYDYAMDKIFFDSLHIPEPEFNLEVGSASHVIQTAKMMIKLESIIEFETPDVVLVYGDTNSTLAGALTASKMKYPVAHIEAGCRSHEPYLAEEINRVVVDHISSILFCSTHNCFENIINEGIRFDTYCVGDVMVDLLKKILPTVPLFKDRIDYILTTIHRADNTDNHEHLTDIISSLGSYKGNVTFPIHPRTKKMVDLFRIKIPKNVTVIAPVDYITMLGLIKNSNGVVTDSGGIQKEAFIIGIPCLTVRDATEWTETFECGWNKLVEPKCLGDSMLHLDKPNTRIVNMFGNGTAAQKIVSILEEKFK